MHPWWAAVTASIAGIIYLIVSDMMVKLRIDDPLDAVAVHGGPGTCTLKKIMFDLHFDVKLIF